MEFGATLLGGGRCRRSGVCIRSCHTVPQLGFPGFDTALCAVAELHTPTTSVLCRSFLTYYCCSAYSYQFLSFVTPYSRYKREAGLWISPTPEKCHVQSLLLLEMRSGTSSSCLAIYIQPLSSIILIAKDWPLDLSKSCKQCAVYFCIF